MTDIRLSIFSTPSWLNRSIVLSWLKDMGRSNTLHVDYTFSYFDDEIIEWSKQGWKLDFHVINIKDFKILQGRLHEASMETTMKIGENNCDGIEITPDIPYKEYIDYLSNLYTLPKHLLFMSTISGKSGGIFRKEILFYISVIKYLYGDNIKIHCDGGINPETLKTINRICIPNVIIVGSFLFKGLEKTDSIENNREKFIKNYEKILNK